MDLFLSAGFSNDYPLIQFNEVLSLPKVFEYLRKEWFGKKKVSGTIV
jgi:hypothetical protein